MSASDGAAAAGSAAVVDPTVGSAVPVAIAGAGNGVVEESVAAPAISELAGGCAGCDAGIDVVRMVLGGSTGLGDGVVTARSASAGGGWTRTGAGAAGCDAGGLAVLACDCTEAGAPAQRVFTSATRVGCVAGGGDVEASGRRTIRELARSP